ncbi:hypothetical protein LAZ67_7001455 [Cordylochernes scorpioides]|uniref:Integrase catalytic domain-containing protein n=1 Tax=Cordylochernes scorpioides TaxID=51811 RepID=A0ABY6KMR7_9ARAC|nr:hypothetical protein LAZ67_7001455 [Cordylochernes scorpioides]
MMAALPGCRVEPQQRSFSIVGMDYFGPMEVSVGRRHEKRYGVLFTCMTTRAIHLEVAHSLTTDSCIMAIRRMICRRGLPLEIFSDNGTNLRGADKELQQALDDYDQEALTENMNSKGIKWNFIPPSAPHMGGSWERLVRSVKTAISVILRSRFPKDEELLTLMLEAEAVRRTKWRGRVPDVQVGDMVLVLDESLRRGHWPLGIVEKVFPGSNKTVRVAEGRLVLRHLNLRAPRADSLNAPTGTQILRALSTFIHGPRFNLALTPGHFLIGNAIRHDAESDHSTLNLRSRWNLIQPQRDYFWDRWSCEYLHQLQERRKWKTSHLDVNIGDLIMLKEQDKPLQWKLARIVQIFLGEDDHTRVVLLRTSKGLLKRPITKICPLPYNTGCGGVCWIQM